jgi:hypothetical protein
MARTKSAGAGSLEPGTTCHSRPRPGLKIHAAALLEASHRPIGRAAGLTTPARRALPEDAFSPRAHHGRNPQSRTPRDAARESRHATTSNLPRKPGLGTGVAGSYMPPRVASSRPVDPADRPPDPKACPPRELPRNSNQSDLWTTHPAVSAKGAERSSAVIGGSVLPREARGHAATRIAPGICVSAGTDCRQSSELEPRH